jgi:enoyl-CoA hydratase
VLTAHVGDHVLVITLNRPAVRNCVDPEMAAQLERAIDRLEQDPDLSVGVLTGAGSAFCGGSDLAAVAAGRAAQMQTERGEYAGFVRAERSKPVIAAVNGPAVGGGMEIAIACDLIVAARGATMALAEVSVSRIPCGGGIARLPRLIGEKAALGLILTGDRWPVERLAELGLIFAVVERDALMAEALALAERICRNAPLAVRAARRAVVDGRDRGETDRWQLARAELAVLSTTEDFLEKRPARWHAR